MFQLAEATIAGGHRVSAAYALLFDLAILHRTYRYKIPRPVIMSYAYIQIL